MRYWNWYNGWADLQIRFLIFISGRNEKRPFIVKYLFFDSRLCDEIQIITPFSIQHSQYHRIIISPFSKISFPPRSSYESNRDVVHYMHPLWIDRVRRTQNVHREFHNINKEHSKCTITYYWAVLSACARVRGWPLQWSYNLAPALFTSAQHPRLYCSWLALDACASVFLSHVFAQY